MANDPAFVDRLLPAQAGAELLRAHAAWPLLPYGLQQHRGAYEGLLGAEGKEAARKQLSKLWTGHKGAFEALLAANCGLRTGCCDRPSMRVWGGMAVAGRAQLTVAGRGRIAEHTHTHSDPPHPNLGRRTSAQAGAELLRAHAAWPLLPYGLQQHRGAYEGLLGAEGKEAVREELGKLWTGHMGAFEALLSANGGLRTGCCGRPSMRVWGGAWRWRAERN